MITIYNNEVAQRCDMCGRKSRIKLTDDELEAYRGYLAGGQLIQECLPSLNRCEREFLKSGYCTNCQEMLFGNGESERIE